MKQSRIDIPRYSSLGCHIRKSFVINPAHQHPGRKIEFTDHSSPSGFGQYRGLSVGLLR